LTEEQKGQNFKDFKANSLKLLHIKLGHLNSLSCLQTQLGLLSKYCQVMLHNCTLNYARKKLYSVGSIASKNTAVALLTFFEYLTLV
jgi:hypothetical protein